MGLFESTKDQKSNLHILFIHHNLYLSYFFWMVTKPAIDLISTSLSPLQLNA
jgi:hypothetical protein